MAASQAPAVRLVELSIRKDRKHYIVTDVARQEYYEMPEVCVAAIRGIQEGRALAELEAELTRMYPEADVDLAGFVRQLLALGLARSVGDEPEASDAAQESGQPARRVSPGLRTLGRVLFHPAAVALYAGLFIANVVRLATVDGLMPTYADLFISPSMLHNIVSWAAIGFAAAVLHECGHSLAMAAEGLPTRWSAGHRLFIPVLETEMNGVWSLAAKRRYVPYLAGMCWDQTLLFAALGLQAALPDASPLLPWLRMISLHLVLTFGFQLLFFMKTDLYYVVENATGSYNLMENARFWLRRRLRLRTDEQAGGEPVAFDGEMRFIRGYALLYVAGIGVSFALLAVYLLPQMARGVRMTLPRLGLSPSEPLFWDAAVFYLQLLFAAAWLIRSWALSAAERAARTRLRRAPERGGGARER